MQALDGRDVTQNPQSFAIGPNTTILTSGQSIGLTVSVLSYTIQTCTQPCAADS